MNAFTEILTTSFATVALTSLAAWLFRQWLVARLTADIKLETDSKLEDLKAQLNRTKDALSGLTSAGHTAYSQSQIALLPHRVMAINTVWSSVLEWSQLSAVSTIVAVMDIDWVRTNSSDPKITETIKILLGSNYLEFLKKRNDTELVSPYVSERMWALYSAFSGFYFSRISKAVLLTFPSLDHAEIWMRINERNLIEAAAPSEILKKYDENMIQGTNVFLEYLKSQILHEFRAELSGTRDSDSAVTNASVILAAANALVQSTEQMPSTPNLKM